MHNLTTIFSNFDLLVRYFHILLKRINFHITQALLYFLYLPKFYGNCVFLFMQKNMLGYPTPTVFAGSKNICLGFFFFRVEGLRLFGRPSV